MSAHDDEFPIRKDESMEPINLCESPAAAAMRYIEDLRANEGASVTILCDNPEACTKDVQSAVEITDEWTDWKPRRFLGESVLQCLAKAASAKIEAESAEPEIIGYGSAPLDGEKPELKRWRVLTQDGNWSEAKGTHIRRDEDWIEIGGVGSISIFHRPQAVEQIT